MTLQTTNVITNYGPVSKFPVTTFRFELERRGSSRRGIPEYSPGEVITGKLFLSCDDSFCCKRVYAALEATAEISYDTSSSWMTRSEDVSPDKHIVIICGDNKTSYVRIEKADHEYRFSIPIKKTRLPGSFVGKYGEINYHVECYIDTRHPANMRNASQCVKIKNYFNLQTVPATLKPVTIEGQQYKSIFSKKTGLKYSLSLPYTGFLPEEQIPFSLFLVNPKGACVTRVFVGLTNKTTFRSQYSAKTSKALDASLENPEPGTVFEWSDSVKIPKGTYPSFSVPIIQNVYTFRIEIYANGNEVPVLQGDLPVTIGTTRESQTTLSPMAELVVPVRSVPRSNSALSIASGTSTLYSMPPSYSQLSSRSPSLHSVETLPPHYEDVGK